MTVVEWSWEKEKFSEGCNASFLTLIPKTSSPIGLNDYRLISLIGLWYKVISKLLAERMKSVVGKLISKEQSDFLKGRSILDGILIANETVEFLKSQRKKGSSLKLTLRKPMTRWSGRSF